MKNVKKVLCVVLSIMMVASVAAVTVSALTPSGNGVQIVRDGKVAWTNKTNYTFSASYKTSRWYQNFTALELGTNERNNVLSVAVSQLGYHEGNSGSGDYSGTNTNSNGNSVEYFRVMSDSFNNDSWCAAFVNWCLNQARINYAYSEISCGNWLNWLSNNNMFQKGQGYGGSYTPKPADMIFFDWDQTGGWPEHIGYVLYVKNGMVYTIEGNSGSPGGVKICSYAIGSKDIRGYGTPPYNEGSEPTFDYSYANGMPVGQYVTRADINLRASGSTAGEVLTTMPRGSRMTLIEDTGSFVKVNYNGQIGYASRDYLFLMMDESKKEVTLTYDANGGTDAPAKQIVASDANTVKIGNTAPVLSGDTFLGWSTDPKAVTAQYKPGDSITVKSNTTLYAVWQKRSPVMATVDRMYPAEILYNNVVNNQGKIEWMQSCRATLKYDKSFVTLSGTGEDGYVAILSPVSSGGPTAKYAAIRYRMSADLSGGVKGEFFIGSGNGWSGSGDNISFDYVADGEWHVVVVNLSSVTAYTSNATYLRYDFFTDATEKEIDVAYVGFFTSEADALAYDKYVSGADADANVPEEDETDDTTVETDATDPEVSETDPETLPADTEDDTEDDADTETPAETDEEESEIETEAASDDGETAVETPDGSAPDTGSTDETETVAVVSPSVPSGCGASVVGLSAITLLVAAGAALMLAKKKD